MSLGAAYEQLITPDGPIYFVGDHVSHVLGLAGRRGAQLAPRGPDDQRPRQSEAGLSRESSAIAGK